MEKRRGKYTRVCVCVRICSWDFVVTEEKKERERDVWYEGGMQSILWMYIRWVGEAIDHVAKTLFDAIS